MDWFLRNAWIIPALPTASFVVILLLGKRFPNKGSEVGIAAVGACFILSILTAIAWIIRPESGDDHIRQFVQHDLFTWFDLHIGAGAEGVSHPTKFGIHIDGFSVMLLFVVSFISLMVHVYSLEYLRGDRRYTYYFAALSLFTASMFVMVTASTTLQLLLGWEGMGVCSFMLIGHWWEDKPNSDAALKAFFTTRTGDIGLLIGIVMTYWLAGQTFDIEKINQAALSGKISHTALLVAAIALFAAAVGKSAQFPLHTWLPDAMAGPTPVSALIHAATMVVAGVYLIGRMYPVFTEAFSIFKPHQGLNLVAIIGGTTVIIAALLAFVQHDIKKVLAYSTISQLGYMVMALGVGAWSAAHLPPLHPCLLQGRPLPRGRIGQPRGLPPQLRHEEGHGGPAEVHAHHVHDLRHRLAGAGRDLPPRRLLVQGRDPGQRRPQRLHRLHDHRHRRRGHDRGLHDPLRVADVLRRVPRPRPSPRVAPA